jgi:hypothetical protein
MTSTVNRGIMVTTFVAAVALAIVAATDTGGISINMSAFAQNGNMSIGGNATEGNMTVPDIAGSGVATPPVRAP